MNEISSVKDISDLEKIIEGKFNGSYFRLYNVFTWNYTQYTDLYELLEYTGDAEDREAVEDSIIAMVEEYLSICDI